MRATIAVLAMVTALFFTGCAAAERSSGRPGPVHAGWYLEHEGRGMFQACGQSRQSRVTGSSVLRSKAKAFGLQPDTPVFVRVTGTLSDDGDVLTVSKVEQFGSAEPVRNCGLTGVVIPAPTSER